MQKENQLKRCCKKGLSSPNTRPSSPRSVSMRGIGAAHTLYPALQTCGMTERVCRARMANHGFTLIELLVVVLIIGILASVALPQYQQAVLKSRVMQVLPYLKAVKNAEEAYYLANGEYTSDMDSLSVEGTAPNGWTFVLRYGGSDKLEATYQGVSHLAVVTSFDHRTDVPEWAGITYCFAATGYTSYEKVCKSMGQPIPSANGAPSGVDASGSRYYISN